MKPNKTLIINLSDDSSILTTQYLLNRNKGLGEVTILTFQENRKATEVLSVDNRVYIDRKEIQNLSTNRIENTTKIHDQTHHTNTRTKLLTNPYICRG